MRLGLTQTLQTKQTLVQSPQMIQAMQILQCPMAELQDQIEQELQENVFLEVKEDTDRDANESGPATETDDRETDEARELGTETDSERLESEFAQELERLEQRTDPISRAPRGSDEDAERRLELLYNTPDTNVSLAEYLLEQVRMQDVSAELYRVLEYLVHSLDSEGRLSETADEVADQLLVPIPLADEAIEILRDLDPPGIGARDLRDCLLMQLDRMSYVRPLTRHLVERHLESLAMNKLPKIAKEEGVTIEDVKDSWAFIRDHLKPHPGAGFGESRNSSVTPDVIIDEVEGAFEVRTERGSIPDLAISSTYRNLLKEARSDPKIYEYLRRKIDGAKWFIEAIHQRQNTIHRIVSEIVRRQSGFLRHGVSELVPMKMQDVADEVGVHISTVSRAISGKYVQTPQGIFEIKRFFSGGTVDDSGKSVSQQAIKQQLRQIVEREDKSSPLSDDQLVEELGKKGVHIARRTVTKYRKALGIESSSRRREY